MTKPIIVVKMPCKLPYRTNFGGKKFWRNCDFEMLAEKTLVNPRLACILIIVRTRQL